MIIGVLGGAAGETRVAATPATVAQLLKLGYDVVVEPARVRRRASPTRPTSRPAPRIGDATARRHRLRRQRAATGAARRAARGRDADQPARPGAGPRPGRRPRAGVRSRRWRWTPCRASRARSRSTCCRSMANIAGYRAVIEAAHIFGRFFTGRSPPRARSRRPRCSSPAPASRASRRSAPPAAWARSSAPPTRVPRSPTRSVAGRRVPLGRGADVEVSATGYAKEMSDDYNTPRRARSTPRTCPTSTSSSPPR